MKLLQILLVLWFIIGIIFTALSLLVKIELKKRGIDTIILFTTPFSDLKKLKSINQKNSNIKKLYMLYKIVNYIMLSIMVILLSVIIVVIVIR
jgi:hypothetical protein